MNAKPNSSLYTFDGAGRPELTSSASDWLSHSREQLAERHDFILDSLGEMDPVRKRLFVQAFRAGNGEQVLAILQANAAAYVEHCIKHKIANGFTGCRDEFEALDELLTVYPSDAVRAKRLRSAA